MKRLVLLLAVCMSVWAYSEESAVSQTYNWQIEKHISISSGSSMSLAPAHSGSPAMLAGTVHTFGSSPHIVILRLDSSGLDQIAQTTEEFYPSAAAYGDINHDSVPEFIFIGYRPSSEPHQVILAVKCGEDGKLDVASYPVPSGDYFRHLAIGDMDGDGKNEIVYYRVDEAAEEYWEGSLVMARVEGGELKNLGESARHCMVGNMVIGDFDSDGHQELAVLEGHGTRKNERLRERAPHLAAYSWGNGRWSKEPKALLPLDPEIDLEESPGLVAWYDSGKQRALMAHYRTAQAYEMADGKWSARDAIFSLSKGSIRTLGIVDLDGRGKESILACVSIPANDPGQPGQRAVYVYQRTD